MRRLILIGMLFVCTSLYAGFLERPFGWNLGKTSSEELRQRFKCTSDKEEYPSSCTRYTLDERRLIAHTSSSRLLIKLEVYEPAREWKKRGLERNTKIEQVRKILNQYNIAFKETVSLVPCNKCKLKDIRRIVLLSFEDGDHFVEMTVKFDDLIRREYKNMPDGSSQSEEVIFWSEKIMGYI